jgi:hypothetical protein
VPFSSRSPRPSKRSPQAFGRVRHHAVVVSALLIDAEFVTWSDIAVFLMSNRMTLAKVERRSKRRTAAGRSHVASGARPSRSEDEANGVYFARDLVGDRDVAASHIEDLRWCGHGVDVGEVTAGCERSQ